MKLAKAVAAVAAAIVAIAATVLVATQLTEVSTAATTQPSTSDTSDTTTVDPGDPVRVTVPAIGVDAQIVAVGLEPDGAMQTPDFGLAGWYSPGPRPGEPGPAVVVAHVDSKANGPDVFYRLRELARGDEITVHYRSTSQTFVVTGKEQTPKTALPTDRIWNGATTPVLRLVTCGGAFDRVVRSYLDNIIIYADRLV